MILVDPTLVMQEAIDSILSQRVRRRWAYYSGDHPKAWVTPKIREIFQGLADSMTENYCGLAINSRISRLEIEGFAGEQPEPAEAIWLASGLPSRQDMLFRWGLVHSVVYLIAGVDDENQNVIAPNPATIAYGAPDPNDWAACQWAAKMWPVPNEAGDGEDWRLVIYDDATVWRFRGPRDAKGKAPVPDDFVPDTVNGPQESHGFESVPVQAAYPFGPFSPSLIDQISPIQDRINKIGSNKFVAAEFGAFRQRVFFTTQDVQPYDLRQTPDHAIVLDPGDAEAAARVQELSATDLSNYDNAKNAEVDALFTIASLPRHMRVNPGAAPSGEAIKADEGPFVESLHDNQREFGEAIVRALAMHGVIAEPTWRDVEVHNDLTNAQVVRTLVESGVPWQLACQRFLGFTEEDILEAEAKVAANSEASLAALGADLRNAVTET